MSISSSRLQASAAVLVILSAAGATVAQAPPGKQPELQVIEADEILELERPAVEIAVSERRGQVQVDGAQTVVEASLAVGVFYAERGDLEQALEVFSRGLERSADSRPLQVDAAVVALRLGRFEQAAEVAEAAVRREPSDGGLQHLLGVALAHLGRLEEARSALAVASASRPDDGAVAASLGQVELRLGDLAAAVTTLRKARSALPGSPAVAANLGTAVALQGDPSTALRLYEEGLESGRRIAELPAPARPAAWRNLGVLRQRAGLSAEAVAAYVESLRLEPEQPTVLLALGGLYEDAERTEDALDAYRRAAEQAAPSLALVLRLGKLESRAGNREAAIRWLSEALPGVEGEERLEVLLALGQAYLEGGDRETAEGTFRQALDADPDSVAARLALGRLLRAAGRLAEASVALQGREDGAPASLAITLELAAVAGETGDREREETLYRQILESTDDATVVVPTQVRLAVLLLLRGATAEAENLAGAALEHARSTSLLSVEGSLRLRTVDALLHAASGSTESARQKLRSITAEGGAFAPAVFAGSVLNVLDGLQSGDGSASAVLSRVLSGVAGSLLEPAVQGAIGQLRWLDGDAAGARQSLVAAAQRFDWMSVRASLGAAEAASGSWSDAAASWREAGTLCGGSRPRGPLVEERGTESWLWVEVGGAEAERDQLCRAVAVAARAASEHHARSLAARGTSSLQAGELEPARQSLEEALAVGLPDRYRGLALNNLGVALAGLGRSGEARARLEDALDSPSVHLSAALNLGIVLDAAGDLEGARRMYGEVAEVDGPRRDEAQRWLEDLSGAIAGASSSSAALVAHLPGAPIEAANRLAEAVTALGEALSQASPGLRVDVRLFRRWADAVVELERDPTAVKLLLTDASALLDLPGAGGDFVPLYRFRRQGEDTYQRLVVVPATSTVTSLSDLGGRSLCVVESAGSAATRSFAEQKVLAGRLSLDGGVGSVEWVPDDFTATANVLYGKTDAALVADYNPLLRAKLEEGELRSIYTSPPLSLPVLSVRRSAFDVAQLGAFERRLLGGDGDGPMSRFLKALALDGLRPVTSGSGPFDREALLGQPPSPVKIREIVAMDPPVEETVLEPPPLAALTFFLGVPLPEKD